MFRSTLLVMAVTLVSCSATVIPVSLPTVTTTSTPPPTVSGVEGFNACARDTGADLPEVQLDANGRPRLAALAIGVELLEPSVREALARCSRFLTESGDLAFEGELRNRVIGTLREFSQCMRDQGVLAFPDPSSDFNGSGDPYPIDDVVRSSPGFTDAAGVCVSAMEVR